MLGRSFGPIGVDLGARFVKAVQMSRSRGTWRIEASAVVPRAEGETDAIAAGRLSNVLDRQGFRGRNVVLAAPVKQVEVDLVEVPPRSSGAPIEQIARTELMRTTKLEAGTFEMASWDLPAAARGSGTTMMAAALRHADANSRLGGFESAGFTPIAIDVACLALAREALAGTATGSDRITGALDIGWSAAMIVLAHRDCVIYQRILPDRGVLSLHTEIRAQFGVNEEVAEHVLRTFTTKQAENEKTELGIDPVHAAWVRSVVARHTDDLAAEVKASFGYAAHRYPGMASDVLRLSGGGAAIPGVVAQLSQRLDLEVKLLGQNESDCRGALLALAAGLARYPEAA
jgi:Tfp pilus assembly PilM family ATPase